MLDYLLPNKQKQFVHLGYPLLIQLIFFAASKGTLSTALREIAMGHGTGKDRDVFCVWKAAGKPCSNKARLSCMGCRYEIRTKALLLRYATNHRIRASSSEAMSEADIARKK